MGKKCCLRHCKKHLGGSEASEIERLFIETSLGTRIVTNIHRSATVSDAKRKIALDHSRVIPGMGEVRILNLQMQHQGQFYYLSESMTLAHAFGEATWDTSLFVEASICENDDKKVGILAAEVKTSSGVEDVDHGTGLLLLPAGREGSIDPSAGDTGRTAAPLAEFTNQEELLQEHLDDDGSGHVVQALQNVHPPGTDEDLAANLDIPEAGLYHGTKKRKQAKKEEIISVGEQSKSTDADHRVDADKNDNVVPQNENDVSNVVEMDRSVSADLLDQSEATGNAGSVGPKKKRSKVEGRNSSVVEQVATDHGLSSAPFEEVANEDPNPQITLTQDASPQASESMDVSGVHSQGADVEVVRDQEGALPPSDACLNEERAADIDGNVSRDENGGADENLVTGQSEDVQGQVMYYNHQENGSSGNRKEKKKKKTKRSRSSAAEDILTSDMEEQSHVAEGSGALPLMPIQEVGDKKALQSMDVLVSVTPREGEEAIQKQEVLLPLVGVHPDQENTEGLYAKEKKKKTKRSHSLDAKEKKKKTRRSHSSVVEDILTSGMEEEQSNGAEGSGAPLMPIQEVGDNALPSMDVSVGEEALQKQEVLSPLAAVHLDHENTEGLDAKEKKKKKKKKKSRSSAAEDIAATGMKELSHDAEELVAQLIPIEEAGDKTSQSMDVSVSVAPREGEEALQKQEALLPLVGVHPDLENDEGLDAKEKKRRKKSRSSAAKDIAATEMKELSHGAEGLVASLIPVQEVGDELAHSVDVPVSVAPSEGEEALQKQEALLPLVDIRPDHEITEELDGNALEVETATEDPVVTEPIVEGLALDQLGRDQEKGSSLMKEKKKRKKGQISTAQNVSNSEVMIQPSHGAEKQGKVQIENNDLGPTITEVPLPETEISDVSKVAKDADDEIDFLKYFMPAKSQSEINSSVNVKGTSQSIKQKKVKDQHHTASTLSETQVLPLKNKKLPKPSQDSGAAQISTLKKGKKPATASRVVEGPAVSGQNPKIAKQQLAFNRNALSTAGKGSNGRSLLKSSGKAKSLFNPERKLFTDSDSENCSGENKTANSNASTLPPSRSSSSSDSSSDSESDASQDSIRTGTATKTSNGAGESVSSKKWFPSMEEMSMDDVIKSSRRFKKTKLTASQSQEPDSQA